MTAEIRQATLDDREELSAFILATYGATGPYKVGERWEWLHVRNPYRDQQSRALPVFVAVKDGKIVGHTCSFPIEIQAGGKVYRGAWGYDMMVLGECRGERLGSRLSQAAIDHYPIYMGMWMVPTTANIYVRAGGVALDPMWVYRKLVRPQAHEIVQYLRVTSGGVAWRRWLTRIGCDVLQLHRVVSVAVKLGLAVRDALARGNWSHPQIEIREVRHFGEEIDRLWAATSHQYDVIVKRDRRFLNWRFLDNHQVTYRCFEAVRDGNVTGFVVLRESEPAELNFGRIIDLYAARDDAETLEALLRHAERFFGRRVACLKCATTVPEYATVLRRLGFHPRGSTVAVFFCADPVLKAQLAEWKDRWFLSDADSDGDKIMPI